MSTKKNTESAENKLIEANLVLFAALGMFQAQGMDVFIGAAGDEQAVMISVCKAKLTEQDGKKFIEKATQEQQDPIATEEK